MIVHDVCFRRQFIMRKYGNVSLGYETVTVISQQLCVHVPHMLQ
jgi:hypothetical protein